MEVEAGRKSDRFWVSAMLSLAAHGALFLFLMAAPAGVPGGVGEARVYSLTYLGALPAGEAGPARTTTVLPAKSGPKTPPTPPVKAVFKPAPAPPAKVPVKPMVAAKQSPAPARLGGNVLASARGAEELPLPPKAPVEKPHPTGPAPEAETGAAPPEPAAKPSPGAPASVPAGGAGVGDDEGTGNPAPPPRGTMMVSKLPKLIYPKTAQNSGVKGTVVLKALVGVDGGRTKVEVERSSGDARLDEYARSGVEKGLLANAWIKPYVVRLEARFERGVPDVRVIDEPVEVGG